VRQRLDAAAVTNIDILPQPVVIVADSTFINRTSGYTVLRSPHLRANLWWKAVANESAVEYREGRVALERAGFTLIAAVVDAKHGTRQVFSGIPVQICHFHQAKIVTTYLTNTPDHSSAQELLNISHSLPRLTEIKLKRKLICWKKRWINQLLKNLRLRSAYRSLCHNLPFLYTYQKFPEFNIPNTTNSLEGTFGQMKQKLKNHRGLKQHRRHKLVNELLSYRSIT
jgi:hypothetical protein